MHKKRPLSRIVVNMIDARILSPQNICFKIIANHDALFGPGSYFLHYILKIPLIGFSNLEILSGKNSLKKVQDSSRIKLNLLHIAKSIGKNVQVVLFIQILQHVQGIGQQFFLLRTKGHIIFTQALGYFLIFIAERLADKPEAVIPQGFPVHLPFIALPPELGIYFLKELNKAILTKGEL